MLDDRTIAIAERPGNRRVDGYRNVLANPHVGLIFLIPGRGDTLRINGRARLVRDADFFDCHDRQGPPPDPRSGGRGGGGLPPLRQGVPALGQLWQPDTWNDPVPPRPVIAKTLERRTKPPWRS